MIMGRSKDSRWPQAVSPAEEWLLMICFSCFLFSCLCDMRIFLFGREKTPGGETRMPNAKVLSEKQAIVAALTERIQNASSGVFVDYKGISVAQDTELRRTLRENGVDYSVVKNTLVRFAIDKVGYNELDPILNGTTSLATTEGDPIAPFRVINDYTKKLGDIFTVKAGFMDGKILSDAEMATIAALPSKEALYAQVLGTMLAPITGLAVVLNQIAEQKNGGPVAAAAEEAPAAEAPAAE